MDEEQGGLAESSASVLLGEGDAGSSADEFVLVFPHGLAEFIAHSCSDSSDDRSIGFQGVFEPSCSIGIFPRSTEDIPDVDVHLLAGFELAWSATWGINHYSFARKRVLAGDDLLPQG